MNEPLYCVNHPKIATYLRCNRCGKPICSKCAVRTPVGYRCRECINTQQKVFYADFRLSDYVIAAVVALPLSLLAGWLIPTLGGFYTFILGPLAGVGIAEAVRWAIRRRRGEYTWLIVCGCIVAGALLSLGLSALFALLPLEIRRWLGLANWGALGLFPRLLNLLWYVVYLAMAAGTAYVRLRPGKRG